MLIALLLIIWVWQNPVGKFGYHGFGFTVYSALPLPYFDLKIHADGLPSIREKSHYVSLEEAEDLIYEKPDVLIIGVGYDELVEVDERLLNSTGIDLEVLETPEAVKRFNELRDGGKRVTAIMHSTC
ncbi:MAG: MTH938/NDUFAF3 family protein [Candidatus Geothermarchaeales archaeon]